MPIYQSQNPPTRFIEQAKNCLYNLKGLESYFSSLWMAGFKADGTTGCGGVDVIALGDSYTQGFGLTTDVQGFGIADNGALQAWPNLLRKYLQQSINPPNVPGGYGFFQLDRSGLADDGAARNPTQVTAAAAGLSTSAVFGGFGSGSGWGNQLCEFKATSGQRYVLVDFNPSYIPCTSIQACGANTLTAKIDVYPTPGNTTPITIGTGSYLAVSAAMAGTDFWGTRTSQQTVNSGVTPPGNYRVQVYNADAATDLFLAGLTIYNKDETTGIRMFNFGAGRAPIDGFSAANSASGTATMGSCAADGSDAAAAKNARLVVVMLGANNYASSKAVFKSAITTLVQAVRAWTSTPSVLLVQQAPQYGVSVGVNDWATLPLMRQRDALKEICDDATMGVYTALYDSWKMYNYISPQSLSSRYNAIQADHIHPTVTAQQLIAQGLAANLVPRTTDLTF